MLSEALESTEIVDKPEKNYYNSFLVALMMLFLPFNYALTIKIGFPLKISELALLLFVFSIFLYAITYRKLPLPALSDKAVGLCLLFFLAASFSTIIHLKWWYSYEPKVYPTRGSYKIESFLKLIYLLINVLTIIVASSAFKVKQFFYLKLILIGATIAACYLWYLSICSYYSIHPFLLPGMDEQPQNIRVASGLRLIRCGTFKEGNYMGVFLLISAVIACYIKKYKTALFLFLSILPTFSTASIVASVMFLVFSLAKRYMNFKKAHYFLSISIVAFGLFIIALQLDTFRAVVINKVFGNADTETNENTSYTFSKLDRLNSVKVSKNILKDNVLFGAGLSNYSMHYDHYNDFFDSLYSNEKPIPNNVYMEVLAETGIVGFFFFAWFLWMLFVRSGRDKSGTLRFGYLALLICLIAFPTFSILFIWVYWGLIISLPPANKSISQLSL